MKPKVQLALFALWLSIVILRVLFYHEIVDRLWVLSFMVDGMIFILGLQFVIPAIVTLFKPPRSRLLLSLGIAAVGICLLYRITPLGARVGADFRFARLKSDFEAEVQRVQPLPEDQVKYPIHVEQIGDARMIGISWGGIVDNWHGVVHDPTGTLASAPADLAANRQILFGYTLWHVRHLEGHWFYCVFT